MSPAHDDESENAFLSLRQVFTDALRGGNLAEAGSLLDYIVSINPEHGELDDLRRRLEEMREKEAHHRPASASAASIDRFQLDEFYEKADHLYQHESYDAALDVLARILVVDPENAEAQRLKQNVLKAQKLAAQIAAEAEMAAREIPHVETPVVPTTGSQVWGSSPASVDSRMFDIASEQQGPMSPPAPPMSQRVLSIVKGSWRTGKKVFVVALVAATVTGGYFLLRRISTTIVPTHESLLVLPATVLSGDPGMTEIADGLSDDLIRKLSMLSNLHVIAPTSAFTFAASPATPAAAARTSGAGKCLQWTVDGSGDRLVIHCSLFDSVKQTPVWQQRFEFPQQELPMQRAELLSAVVRAAGIRASEEDLVALHKFPTVNSFAYVTYLRGRAMMHHAELHRPGDAIQVLERALAADSLFADAYAALGWAHCLAIESGDTARGHSADAMSAVQRAVALGFRNAEAFRVWGAIEWHNKQYAKAIERFENAVNGAPSDAEARRRLALAQMLRGQSDAALASAQQALQDDPQNVVSYTVLGLIQQYIAVASGDARDDYAIALRTFERGKKLSRDRNEYAARLIATVYWYIQQPERSIDLLNDYTARARQNYEGLYMLGRVQQAAGRAKPEWLDVLSRGRAVLQELSAKKNAPAEVFAWLGLYHTRLGEFKDAMTVVEEALKLGGENPRVQYLVARIYALQRDFPKSSAHLRRAVDGDYDLEQIVDMDLFNLHGDPDFTRAITR